MWTQNSLEEKPMTPQQIVEVMTAAGTATAAANI
jgi:hypothetical protein